MRNFLIGLVVLMALVIGAAAWWLQDANRLKPNLEQLLSEQSGATVSIRGDLSWQLFPPVELSAESVRIDFDGDLVDIGQLALDIDLWTLLREGRAPEDWDVRSITLTDTNIQSGVDQIAVATLTLDGFGLERPTPFSTELTYTAPEQAPRPLQATGVLTLGKDDSVRLTDTRIITTEAEGVCEVDARPAGGSWPEPVTTPDDLLPVSLLRAWRADLSCTLDELALEGETFSDVDVSLTLRKAVADVAVTVPEFFGGRAQVNARVDATGRQPAWRVQPELEDVNSQQLVDWLEQPLAWAAPLALEGALTFRGNTEAELAASVRGETRFDGHQGLIDISKLKEPALSIAQLSGDVDKVQRWPNPWRYQRLVGTWQIEGSQHRLNFDLDNLNVRATGTYDVLADQADLLAEVTFGDDPDLASFDANELLVGVPIPMRCRGTLASLACQPDQAAARRVLAGAIGGDTELRRKLDEKIDEEVPEEYRDAARALLDLLGNQDN